MKTFRMMNAELDGGGAAPAAAPAASAEPTAAPSGGEPVAAEPSAEPTASAEPAAAPEPTAAPVATDYSTLNYEAIAGGDFGDLGEDLHPLLTSLNKYHLDRHDISLEQARQEAQSWQDSYNNVWGEDPRVAEGLEREQGLTGQLEAANARIQQLEDDYAALMKSSEDYDSRQADAYNAWFADMFKDPKWEEISKDALTLLPPEGETNVFLDKLEYAMWIAEIGPEAIEYAKTRLADGSLDARNVDYFLKDARRQFSKPVSAPPPRRPAAAVVTTGKTAPTVVPAAAPTNQSPKEKMASLLAARLKAASR